MTSRKGQGYRIFLDGTSNSLLAVEAGEPVPRTKPQDLPYDPKKPLPKLGGLFPEGFHAAYCDGSVRLILKGVKENTLRALITRAGERKSCAQFEPKGALRPVPDVPLEELKPGFTAQTLPDSFEL